MKSSVNGTGYAVRELPGAGCALTVLQPALDGTTQLVQYTCVRQRVFDLKLNFQTVLKSVVKTVVKSVV